jgi:hypothetical protein
MAKYRIREQTITTPLNPAPGDDSSPTVRLLSSIGRGSNMLPRYWLPLAQ